MTFVRRLFKDGNALTEGLFLAAFSCYLIFFYLQTTTFAMNVPGLIYSVVRAVLLGCALYRLYIWRGELNPVTAAVLAAFSGLGLFYFISRGDLMVLDAALMTAAAYKVSFKRIGIIYVFTGLFISLLALVCSQTGVITDYTFLTNYGENDRIRHSLGIIYPTDCFAHIFYIAVIYFIIRWKRITYAEIIGAGAVFAVFFRLTSARADLAGALLMLLLVLVMKLTGYKGIKVNDKLRTAGARVFTCILMPVCAVFILAVTYLYDSSNSFMYVLDSRMSYRLSLGKTGLDLYGFKLLGSPNFAENGNANGGIRNYTYVFYDSAYIKYLFKYGLLLLAVLFVVYALIGLRLYSSKMFYAMVFISVIALTYIIEHHMLELSYNITLLLLTADISTILQSSPYINNKKSNGIITKTD